MSRHTPVYPQRGDQSRVKAQSRVFTSGPTPAMWVAGIGAAIMIKIIATLLA
ncbi:hypothetical protein [Varunaivibrio sulfuroxidans]|uniref:Uncharacterized protein n=1 Tax=Varunaivibrio sulfuroxidans TaxID=1773489 RepID=A0A4R3JA99_9PROT|nr:hypothetical protein [Varunaivibrio sulfuroxidans]TCS62464.1 hypothetical protein EDD55_1059 [Varunaivibrio sulfuroxidans]WES30860.1 hypothetical protein P3M64_00335 [Varunaivibrio sulfuroxidans]